MNPPLLLLFPSVLFDQFVIALLWIFYLRFFWCEKLMLMYQLASSPTGLRVSTIRKMLPFPRFFHRAHVPSPRRSVKPFHNPPPKLQQWTPTSMQENPPNLKYLRWPNLTSLNSFCNPINLWGVYGAQAVPNPTTCRYFFPFFLTSKTLVPVETSLVCRKDVEPAFSYAPPPPRCRDA